MLEFENEGVPLAIQPFESPSSATPQRSRLARYLHELALRPNDPPHDLDDPNANPDVSTPAATNVASSLSSLNPEADSFSYMETVLESLAVLSRLGSALDIVAQRVSVEIFNLVETTLEEVSERAEYGRRGSVYTILGGHSRTEGVYTFAGVDSAALATKMGMKTYLNPSCLRLSALESSAKQVELEVLKDFFWTLYSKMDAVAQGLRVVYEVANRIGSVSELYFIE